MDVPIWPAQKRYADFARQEPDPPALFPLDSFLPEVPAHGAVDDEVEAGVEGDEQGGDAGGGNSIESQQLFYQVFTPEWDTTMHKIFFNQGISCVKISC